MHGFACIFMWSLNYLEWVEWCKSHPPAIFAVPWAVSISSRTVPHCVNLFPRKSLDENNYNIITIYTILYILYCMHAVVMQWYALFIKKQTTLQISGGQSLLAPVAFPFAKSPPAQWGGRWRPRSWCYGYTKVPIGSDDWISQKVFKGVALKIVLDAQSNGWGHLDSRHQFI